MDAVAFSALTAAGIIAALARKGARVPSTEDVSKGALRDVPFMGVIYVVRDGAVTTRTTITDLPSALPLPQVAEASKLGFYNGNPEWSNLGQGQPVRPARGCGVANRPLALT